MPSGKGCESGAAAGSGGGVGARQINFEGGAGIQFAVNADVAAALADDAVAGGQAEAGALAEALGGEERLEQMRLDVLGHAHAVVADGEHDVFADLQGAIAETASSGQW